MKRPFVRDIPKGAALSVLALVLLATVVMGRDESGATQRIDEDTASPAPPTKSADRTASVDDLDLDRLRRPKARSEPQNLFATRSWTPPAPPVIAVVEQEKPAPAPGAPPLPFKYLGRMADSEKLVVFLEQGSVAVSAGVGETLHNTYVVEMISESAVRFVYLPLGTTQVLPIPALK